MKRNRYRLRKTKYYSIVFSTVCGVMLIFFMILLLAFARYGADIPAMALSVMLSLTLCGGGFLSGYLHGRTKRHKGILCGVKCGMILYTVIFVSGIFYLGTVPQLKFLQYLPLLCISGATGGVVGVNSIIKKPPFRAD